MTTMLPTEATQDCSTEHDDGLDHLVCCHDDNRTMCGLDASDIPWVVPGNEKPDCVVCADLNRCEPDSTCTCPCCVDLPIGYGVA